MKILRSDARSVVDEQPRAAYRAPVAWADHVMEGRIRWDNGVRLQEKDIDLPGSLSGSFIDPKQSIEQVKEPGMHGGF